MDLRDRYTRGFIAGIVSGIAMNITNVFSYYANIAELRYLDWAAVMIYGYKPTNFLKQRYRKLVSSFSLPCWEFFLHT